MHEKPCRHYMWWWWCEGGVGGGGERQGVWASHTLYMYYRFSPLQLWFPPLVLFLLQNIMQCCKMFSYFFRFPPPWESPCFLPSLPLSLVYFLPLFTPRFLPPPPPLLPNPSSPTFKGNTSTCKCICSQSTRLMRRLMTVMNLNVLMYHQILLTYITMNILQSVRRIDISIIGLNSEFLEIPQVVHCRFSLPCPKPWMN